MKLEIVGGNTIKDNKSDDLTLQQLNIEDNVQIKVSTNDDEE